MPDEVDLNLTPEEDERLAARVIETLNKIPPEQWEAERKRLDAWVAMHREQDPNWVPMGRDLKPPVRPRPPRPPIPRHWRALERLLREND